MATMARGVLRAFVLVVAAGAAFAEGDKRAEDAVAASNGVVVRGVDSKLLAARLRDPDRKALAGDARGAGARGPPPALARGRRVRVAARRGPRVGRRASRGALRRARRRVERPLARARRVARPSRGPESRDAGALARRRARASGRRRRG